MKLTADQIERAKFMRSMRTKWEVIARALHCSSDTVRRTLDPAYGRKRRQQINDARAARRLSGPTEPGRPPDARVVPAHVLADRDRRRLLDLTPNMAVLGDPPPGRSALDKMRGADA